MYMYMYMYIVYIQRFLEMKTMFIIYNILLYTVVRYVKQVRPQFYFFFLYRYLMTAILEKRNIVSTQNILIFRMHIQLNFTAICICI